MPRDSQLAALMAVVAHSAELHLRCEMWMLLFEAASLVLAASVISTFEAAVLMPVMPSLMLILLVMMTVMLTERMTVMLTGMLTVILTGIQGKMILPHST